jgi:hypothetical protein
MSNITKTQGLTLGDLRRAWANMPDDTIIVWSGDTEYGCYPVTSAEHVQVRIGKGGFGQSYVYDAKGAIPALRID